MLENFFPFLPMAEARGLFHEFGHREAVQLFMEELRDLAGTKSVRIHPDPGMVLLDRIFEITFLW